MGLGCLVEGTAMMAAPYTGSLAGFIALIATMGLGLGVIDVGK